VPACSDCPSGNVGVDAQEPAFRRVLWIALLVNFTFFVVEIIASRLGDSLSLQADAIDFFSDSANYAISLLVVGMALSARAKASLFKGASMALLGSWVVGSAVYRVFTESTPDPATMGIIAFLALGANVAVAWMLFRFRDGDSNRQSIWLCSRNDAIGNVAVMLAATGVFASGSHWPDLVVAGIIASLSLSAALRIIRLAHDELRGAHAGHELNPGQTMSTGQS
jgi:cation diffusion facilitator family transporter